MARPNHEVLQALAGVGTIIIPPCSESAHHEAHQALAGVDYLFDYIRFYVWHVDMPVATREGGIVIFFNFWFMISRTSCTPVSGLEQGHPPDRRLFHPARRLNVSDGDPFWQYSHNFWGHGG